MGQRCPPVDADEQGHVLLLRWQRCDIVELVVHPRTGDRLAVEQCAQYLDGFAETLLAQRGWVERLSHGGVLGETVAGSDAYLEPSSAHVVEDQGADPDPFCAQRCPCEGDEGRRFDPDMVTDLEDVEAGLLGHAGITDDLLGCRGRGLQAETEWPHRVDDTGRRRAPCLRRRRAPEWGSEERSGASDAGRRGGVMLKKLGSPDTVLAVEVVGKLEKDDYVLVPGLQALLDAYGEIRCVFVFGDQYAGLTVGGTVEDSKLYLSELVHRDIGKWKRCAVVTSHDWLRHAISVFRFMMPGDVECFELAQAEAAIEWAGA